MSIWDLRQVIESAVPAWVAFAALFVAVVVLAYGYLTRRRKP